MQQSHGVRLHHPICWTWSLLINCENWSKWGGRLTALSKNKITNTGNMRVEKEPKQQESRGWGCSDRVRSWEVVPGVCNDIRKILWTLGAADPVSTESLSTRDGSRPAASVWHLIGDIDYRLSYVAGNLQDNAGGVNLSAINLLDWWTRTCKFSLKQLVNGSPTS